MCVAPDPDIHGPVGTGRDMLNGLIYHLTHTLNIIRMNFPLGGLLLKKFVKRRRCQWCSPCAEAQLAVAPCSEQEPRRLGRRKRSLRR